MFKILLGATVATTAYLMRRRGMRVLLPWEDGCGTLGFHVSDRTYFDLYRSFGKVGIFWCRRNEDGDIVERGWFSRSGSWKIESTAGVARGRWTRLRHCRKAIL